MSIVKEFEARQKADKVLGTIDWLYKWEWQDRAKLEAYLHNEVEPQIKTLSRRQKTVLYLILDKLTSVMDIDKLKLDLAELDEEEIQEVMSFYNLDNPKERYKEIRSDINGPESFLTRIPYPLIIELYKRKKVPFDRQIFVGCLVRFNVWHGTKYKELSEKVNENLTAVFPTDDFTLDLLMAVFEMELGINNAFYFHRDYNIGGIIIALTQKGILKRDSIHSKIFEAFNNPNLKQTTHGWARDIHKDLLFSSAELMQHQDKFINLLHNDRNILAIYGLQVLKKLSNEATFNWNLFCSNLEGIVYREKFNSGFNLALDMLKKQLKKDAQIGKKACISLAPIFLQPDPKIQLKAKTIFEMVEPCEELIDALSPYVDTMHTEVKKGLSHFLPEVQPEVVTIEKYKQEKYSIPVLKDTDTLEYINSEDDFIFHISKALKSTDSLDFELFLEGFSRFAHLSTSNPNALKPALKQAKRMLPDYYANITNKVGANHLMLAKFICIWLDPTASSFEEDTKKWKLELTKNRNYTANQWLTYFRMISRITNLVSQPQGLPLLSIPTHNNGQLHPEVFLQRLAQYEKVSELPLKDDFDTALCRLNCSTSFKSELLQGNKKCEYRTILHYFFNQNVGLDPEKIKKRENSWLVAYCIKNPNKAIDAALAYQKDETWWNTETSWTWEAARRYGTEYSWATTAFHLDAFENGLKKDCFFGYNFAFHYTRISDVAHWFHRDMFQTETLYLNLCDKNFSYLNIEAENTRAVMATIKYSIENLNPIAKAGHTFLVLSLFCQDKSLRAAALEWLCQLIEYKMLDLNLFITASKKLLVNEHHPIPMARVYEQLTELIALRGTYENVTYQMLNEIIKEIPIDNLPKGFSKILNQYYEIIQISNENIPKVVLLKLEEMGVITSVKKIVKKLLNFKKDNDAFVN